MIMPGGIGFPVCGSGARSQKNACPQENQGANGYILLSEAKVVISQVSGSCGVELCAKSLVSNCRIY